MYIKNKLRLKLCAYTALPFVLAATVAQAADTDVYLNQSSTVFPNVLFSLDTSGSMEDWYATIAIPPDYDASASYTGSFDNNSIYFSPSGRIPTSTNGFPRAPLGSLANCNFATTPMDTDGFTAFRAAVAFTSAANLRYPADLWLPVGKTEFNTSNVAHLKLECEDDSGIHGGGGGGKYASNQHHSLYSHSPAEEIDWEKYPFATVFTGHYLNYKNNPPADILVGREVVQSRVVRDAIKRTPDIMAGLARMYAAAHAIIIRAAKDNSVRANQQELLDTLAAVKSGGGTPLATTMLEIMHYFHGKQVNNSSEYYHGAPREIKKDPNRNWSTFEDGIFQIDPSAHSGGQYISPIQFSCQKNYTILITDGEPNNDEQTLEDFVSSNTLYPDYYSHTGKTTCDGNCLDEIAGYAGKADASSSLPNLFDLDGDSIPDPQTVKVYPIGMEIQQALLDDTAAASGTTSYSAKNSLEFENAFIEILAAIKETGGVSMVTATSSNDRFSKTSNREFLYYGQFVPTNNFRWKGNLKKYRYAYDSNDVAYITDTDLSNPDITAADGSLIPSTKSYWSSTADGNNALKGGVLDRLRSKGTASRFIRGINSVDDTEVAIMSDSNTLNLLDSYYNDEVGANDRSTAERQNIRDYALGKDVKDEDADGITNEQRGSIGGITRSAPLAVQYGGTAADPEVVIFATTTDGVLHAFDDETGNELWAVVMPEAYPFLAQQYDNHFSSAPWWGIDGSMSVRVIDQNADGIIEGSDKVYLYISGGLSLRRWFLIDVTNATKTTDQATLVRRGKFDADKPNWDELGLAISPMVPISYQLGGTSGKQRGMIYANGWDPAAEFSYGPSSMGRGISLYDATNGDPLWQMTKQHGGSGMDYAFATQPTAIDTNGDGLTDLIYAIDVNAQIWRFNVNNGTSGTGSLITGGKLATLGKNSDGNRRRAYKRIDAAVINTGSESQVLLAVGTGDRMNPLSETDQDHLYVIRDKTALSGENPTKVLKNSDFYDASQNTLGEGSDSAKLAAQTLLNSKSGWFIKLPNGKEKSISAPLISSGIVNFPVYQVGGSSSDPCENNSSGTAALYRMNVLDATPISDYSDDGSLSVNDRKTNIRGGGIPGDVVVHTSATGIKTIGVSRDFFVDRPNKMHPNLNATPDDSLQGDAAGYWFEEEVEEEVEE